MNKGAANAGLFVYFRSMDAVDIQKKIIPVLKKHHIKKAGLFGSYARNEATPASDIDILVELDSTIGLLDFIGIKQELEDLLLIKVDLVEYRAVKPSLRKYILDSELRIYG